MCDSLSKVIYNIKFSKDQIQLINCSNKNIIVSETLRRNLQQQGIRTVFKSDLKLPLTQVNKTT